MMKQTINSGRAHKYVTARENGIIQLPTVGVWIALAVAALAITVPMTTSAQIFGTAIESVPTTAKGRAVTPNSTQSMDNGTSAQTGSLAEPGDSTSSEVEIQRIFNELRRELLDDREKDVDRWLIVITIVLAFFALVAVLGGYISISLLRDIKSEASKSAESVAKLEETAKQHVAKIKENMDESGDLLQSLDTELFANNSEKTDQIIPDDSDTPRVPVIDRAIDAALDFQRNGNNEKAIDKWQAISNIMEGFDNDITARALFSLGYLRQDNDPEGGISAYDQVIRLKPDFAAAYNNRGLAKQSLKKYDDAIDDYNEAIRLKPDHAAAYYNRGIVKAALEKYDDAIDDYNEAIRLKSDYVVVYNNRGLAKTVLEKYDDAIDDYNEAIRLKPDHAAAYYNRGNIWAVLDLKDKARKDFVTALKLAQNAGYINWVDIIEQLLRNLDSGDDG